MRIEVAAMGDRHMIMKLLTLERRATQAEVVIRAVQKEAIIDIACVFC